MKHQYDMLVVIAMLILVLAHPISAQTSTAATNNNTTSIDEDLIDRPSDDIDLDGCFRDLALSDRNGDGVVKRNEYLNFVQEYGKRICFETDALTLQQSSTFIKLACICDQVEGASSDCCLGDNAQIPVEGALSDGRSASQTSFLTTVCKLTDDTIDARCPPIIDDRGEPIVPIVPGNGAVAVAGGAGAGGGGLSDAAKWGLIAAAIAFLLLLCCCLICVWKRRRVIDEEEEEEEIQVNDQEIDETGVDKGIDIEQPMDRTVASSDTNNNQSRDMEFDDVPRNEPSEVVDSDPSEDEHDEELGVSDVSPVDVSPADVSPADVSPADVSPADVSPADVSPADVSPDDVSPDDVSPADVSPSDVSPAGVIPMAAGTVARGATEGEDSDEEEEVRKKRGGGNIDSEPEEDKIRYVGAPGILPPEPEPQPPIQLRPIPDKDEHDDEWDQPGRDIQYPVEKDEISVGDVEHDEPDGGVYFPDRPTTEPSDWNRNWNRTKPEEPDEVDSRKHRIQSGLGEGAVWNQLDQESTHVERAAKPDAEGFDWVIQSALGALETTASSKQRQLQQQLPQQQQAEEERHEVDDLSDIAKQLGDCGDDDSYYDDNNKKISSKNADIV